tara:strand:+ start:945 stop:1379 length:435 start_codon:yes stop_codon:yes gene_type:complete
MSQSQSQLTIEKANQIIQRNELRRTKHKQAMRKWYIKKTQLSENATMEEVVEQKKRLEKRDNYGKSYYQLNKDKIMDKQRQKRARIRVEKAMMANDKRRQNELLKRELEQSISNVINKTEEKEELKEIMEHFKDIQNKIKFINE